MCSPVLGVIGVRYEGKESISLAESADRHVVHQRITNWLHTDIGSHYRIHEKTSEELSLKKTWISNLLKAVIAVWLLSDIITLYSMFFAGSFELLINNASYAALGFLFLLCVAFLFFKSCVFINVHIQDSTVLLELDSTSKAEAETDFDSLIRAIGNSQSAFIS
jgi:hypothetical protein